MHYRIRYLLLLLVDAVLVNSAVFFSLLLRFEGQIPSVYLGNYISLVPLITVVSLLFLMGFKLYNRIWEYASIPEMLNIFTAVSCSVLTMVLIVELSGFSGLPRSVCIASWILMVIFIGGSRISWRLLRDFCLKKESGAFRNIMIIGAGDAGAILVREIESNPYLRLNPVAFIDDDKAKQKMMLSGVPVRGTREKIPALVKTLDIDEIIIAMPSVPGEQIKEIVEICRKTNARLRILPGIYQSINDKLLSNLRDVEMEDLLKRESVSSDIEEIAKYIKNKVVLITGAGGSIGSELCRQLTDCCPHSLVLLDCCENNLFDIEMELVSLENSSLLYTELADVKDRDRLKAIFQRYRPDVVFHAAAYKHVPMLERHPEEAINNNVAGTRNIAELASLYEVKTFIMISTDKAVNPSSIMGASKRIGELIIKDINRRSNTNFATVRFGNVLGSRGSVIPTFMQQIRNGGPITVTHPEMSRYFMTIAEAVQLVIQAGAMAQGGEIFVLDMGDPVKIVDLARDLIRLSGLEADRDIEIVYTGIRPGEKLAEELFTGQEGMMKTRHERIFISWKELDDQYQDIFKTINLLLKKPVKGRNEVLKMIMNLLPEYKQAVENLPEKETIPPLKIQEQVGDEFQRAVASR